jgi:hypothetical protein
VASPGSRPEEKLRVSLTHGPNNYKDTKPCMSSLLVFSRVYRLEMQSVMLVFSNGFLKHFSLTFSGWHLWR